MLGKLKDMLDLALGHNKKKVFLEEEKKHTLSLNPLNHMKQLKAHTFS